MLKNKSSTRITFFVLVPLFLFSEVLIYPAYAGDLPHYLRVRAFSERRAQIPKMLRPNTPTAVESTGPFFIILAPKGEDRGSTRLLVTSYSGVFECLEIKRDVRPDIGMVIIDIDDLANGFKGLGRGKTVTIGRESPDSRRFSLAEDIAEAHLSISWLKPRLVLEDLGSETGTSAPIVHTADNKIASRNYYTILNWSNELRRILASEHTLGVVQEIFYNATGFMDASGQILAFTHEQESFLEEKPDIKQKKDNGQLFEFIVRFEFRDPYRSKGVPAYQLESVEQSSGHQPPISAILTLGASLDLAINQERLLPWFAAKLNEDFMQGIVNLKRILMKEIISPEEAGEILDILKVLDVPEFMQIKERVGSTMKARLVTTGASGSMKLEPKDPHELARRVMNERHKLETAVKKVEGKIVFVIKRALKTPLPTHIISQTVRPLHALRSSI